LCQKSSEDVKSKPQLKRKNDDAVPYSRVKIRRMVEFSTPSLEDDDDVLIIDTDEELLREMDELLCDLKL
jgi:hypothetical protein